MIKREKKMKKLTLLALTGLLLSSFMGSVVYASTIYDNGAPNQLNGNEMTQWIQTEDFRLSATRTFNEVKFWAVVSTDGTYTGNITYYIYGDNAGIPGNILSTGNLPVPAVATGMNTSFGSELLLDFPIAAFTANANTLYHLGLHNGPIDHNTRDNFYWETTNGNLTTTGIEWELPNGSWSNNFQEHAFQLLGDAAAVPEPATMLLLGSGLIGLAAFARRKFKK